MKNAELEALLKQRGLPHTGKKADLVSRLQEDDGKQSTDPGAATGADAPVAATAEDEIDWNDDEPPKPAEATSEPAAAAMAAGGVGRVENPTAVPNQVVDATDINNADTTVHPPAETEEVATGATGEAAVEEKPEEPKPDFSRGLADISMEEELEKRRARAKKFGIEETDEEAIKKIERAKKFGTEGGESGGPKGLNEALPERRPKRGREDSEGARGDFKRGRGRGRFNRGGGGGGNGGRGPRRDGARVEKSSGGGTSWMNDKDRAAAEARKSRFQSSTS
ncbi:hypothetical protein LTS18_000486 [Coniosporium uncinatum]|uniref:Uncharacterized protein n=1 Tax=Coniosporium uncinatum TaxID=93489 RepID=A0ACC3CUM9_9PEZI|nr:hypothetical protein LTS18_000486 [Coniosporium uncinatum]